MTGRLQGKVAFISGVARGQGRSHAIRLAEEGADIIGFDALEPQPDNGAPPATQADLDETVAAVEALDRRIVAMKADVRDQAQVDAVVAEGVSQFGRLDIVSGNAGITGAPGPVQDLSDEGFVDMQEVNLIGVWRTAKAAIPHMIEAGNGGSIVLTSSAAGLKAYGNMAHYVSAKHGLVGLMRTLAVELGQHNIRVNSIHPTQVDTPMIMNDTVMEVFGAGGSREKFAEISQAMHVLPIPWVESVDISNALVFLSSDEARYITGVTLPVDAGVNIK